MDCSLCWLGKPSKNGNMGHYPQKVGGGPNMIPNVPKCSIGTQKGGGRGPDDHVPNAVHNFLFKRRLITR